ncbi:hypothetical protein MUP79_10625 [Candidatus Bathyarchaeota archaeon]|nr:hypothetical protein [Candidatus Bathyarchaeota archaeon]
MFKPYRAILASLILLCLVSIVIVIQVKAQGDQIESEVLPSQGNANAVILIRFRTKNATIGNVDKADFFWDNSTVALNRQGILGADGSYNYNLTVPSETPLSDVGDHTIRVDSLVFNYGQVSFNFTFTIIEFVPSPEYIALNTSYHSLLANYTDLLTNYDLLLSNFSKMSTDYTALMAEHSQLLLDYNSLSANYNSLTANYNSLTANYNSLSANYNSLLTDYNSLDIVFSSLRTNYTSLQRSFESLSSNYGTMTQYYSTLNSSYTGLRADYDATSGQLAFSRNLTYVFIASTIILAVTSIFFATRKPNPASKPRYQL